MGVIAPFIVPLRFFKKGPLTQEHFISRTRYIHHLVGAILAHTLVQKSRVGDTLAKSYRWFLGSLPPFIVPPTTSPP